MGDDKVKLSFDGQINDMKEKGISFEICSENTAKKFLMNNTYYFKIKAYEKNYSNDNREHKYKNLDFAYIMELSKIDMYLRRIILEMCLDIEHVLKTRLVYDCTINCETNGYDVVKDFLDSQDYSVEKSIIDKAKGKSACSKLAAKYYDSEKGILKAMPLWIIVEVLSFGDFTNLYTFYYQKYKKRNNDYSSYLGAIKYLRNASAHSNCLIYSLKKVDDFKPTMAVMNALSSSKHIESQTRRHKMSVPVIHDFVTLLLVYNDLLSLQSNQHMKDRKMNEIKEFFLSTEGRILAKKEYFQDNKTLVEAYDFICAVLKLIDNHEHKPGGKRLLKTN